MGKNQKEKIGKFTRAKSDEKHGVKTPFGTVYSELFLSLSLSLSDPAVNSTVSCIRPWAATHTRINAATLRLSVFGYREGGGGEGRGIRGKKSVGQGMEVVQSVLVTTTPDVVTKFN